MYSAYKAGFKRVTGKKSWF